MRISRRALLRGTAASTVVPFGGGFVSTARATVDPYTVYQIVVAVASLVSMFGRRRSDPFPSATYAVIRETYQGIIQTQELLVGVLDQVVELRTNLKVDVLYTLRAQRADDILTHIDNINIAISDKESAGTMSLHLSALQTSVLQAYAGGWSLAPRVILGMYSILRYRASLRLSPNTTLHLIRGFQTLLAQMLSNEPPDATGGQSLQKALYRGQWTILAMDAPTRFKFAQKPVGKKLDTRGRVRPILPASEMARYYEARRLDELFDPETPALEYDSSDRATVEQLLAADDQVMALEQRLRNNPTRLQTSQTQPSQTALEAVKQATELSSKYQTEILRKAVEWGASGRMQEYKPEGGGLIWRGCEALYGQHAETHYRKDTEYYEWKTDSQPSWKFWSEHGVSTYRVRPNAKEQAPAGGSGAQGNQALTSLLLAGMPNRTEVIVRSNWAYNYSGSLKDRCADPVPNRSVYLGQKENPWDRLESFAKGADRRKEDLELNVVNVRRCQDARFAADIHACLIAYTLLRLDTIAIGLEKRL